MASAMAAWAACLFAFWGRAQGQVYVMAPESLVQQYSKTRGSIEGSTATFGAPFYGDRVLGRLVYGESLLGLKHCKDEDYNVPEAKMETKGGSGYKEMRLINIILVRRGDCSFTTKVKVAYAKGAHAVIIVDKEESDLTAKDLRNIIVADDGYGESIRIPSVLISKDDGRPLIEAAKRQQVIVELAWNLPTNHVVRVDLWMSAASRESLKFLKEFAPKRRTLNRVLSFQPHFAIFGMDSADQMTAGSLCSDRTGKYCAEDPDGPGPVTGRDVLDEDLRQLCIHDIYKKTAKKSVPEGVHKVEYAAEFWDYIERFPDRCPLSKFGVECSRGLMKEVGIAVAQVDACVKDTGDKKLENERKYPAWSPRALRINGWRYSGVLDADLVTRAVCSGFTEQPEECKELIKPRDPFTPFGDKTVEGVSFSTLIGWLFGTVIFASAALLLYKRYLKKEMRATLREEVMLEVQAQIGEYSRLQGK